MSGSEQKYLIKVIKRHSGSRSMYWHKNGISATYLFRDALQVSKRQLLDSPFTMQCLRNRQIRLVHVWGDQK